MNDLIKKVSSEISTPEQLIDFLAGMAQEFQNSQEELDAAWQNTNGDFWAWAGYKLDELAAHIDTNRHKHI